MRAALKTVALIAGVVVAGLAVGGGAAYATRLVGQSNRALPPPKAAPETAPTFVPIDKLVAPIVFPGGQLAGYVSFDFDLQIAADQVLFVQARLPFLLHGINMRTYRTPMTSGPDGMLPDLTTFRTIVMAAAVEAFGPGIVKRAVITQATPVSG